MEKDKKYVLHLVLTKEEGEMFLELKKMLEKKLGFRPNSKQTTIYALEYVKKINQNE